MADAKIINYGQQISAGSTAIPDNTAVALDIESTDAKDYITLQTTDSDERIILSQELTVPDGSINNPSIRFTGHNTGIHNDSGHIAAVLQGSRTYKLGSAHFQRYDVARGFEIDTAAATTTNPVYAFNGDTDTGVGTGAADQLSLIAGGVEGVRITEAGDAISAVDVKGPTKVTGPGGTTGMALAANNTALLVENHTGSSATKCQLDINSSGADGSQIRFFTAGTEYGGIVSTATNLTIKTERNDDPICLNPEDEGGVIIGGTVSAHKLHVQDGDLGIVTNNASDATAKTLVFTRSRSDTDGTAVVVQDNDILGNIEFQGAEDGDSFAAGAKIFARVNGTPGDGDMPTELVFCTTPDGAEAAAERMYIFENGSVGIGDTGNTSKKLSVTGDVRFSANVLGGSFSDVSDSSWKVDPNSQTTSAKLAGPIALAAIGSEPASIVNCAQIYAKDVSTSAEMFVVDEAGNETQLSPHNFEMFTPDAGHSQPWSYTSKNAYIGKEVGVDMFGLVKAVEELSGKTLMFERDLPDEEIKDWYVEQGKIQAARETAITEWDASKAAEDGGISSNQPRPEPYTIKDPPAWLKSRLKLGNG